MVASPSRRTTNRPWKGRGYVMWHVLNFVCPIHVSGMAEARALKLCSKGDYIRSGQRDEKSPLKRAWFCSRDPFFCMHSCVVRQKSPLHSVTAINHVLDGGFRLSHLWHTLRLKLHQFDFSLCLLQTCLYNIQTTNRSSGVWALSFKYAVKIEFSWCAQRFAINRRSLRANYTWWAVQ